MLLLPVLARLAHTVRVNCLADKVYGTFPYEIIPVVVGHSPISDS